MSQYATIRTTVTIPINLIEQSKKHIDAGTIPNRNTLMVTALKRFLKELDNQEIDRQFAAMADDEEYQKLNLLIAEEYEESDWEALKLGELEIS